MKSSHKRIALALCIGAIIILIRVFKLDNFLTIETFQHYRNQILSLTSTHYIFAVFIFIMVYVAVAALSIPGAAILTLAAGVIFGFPGIFYVNLGATIGAALAFLAARFLFGNWIQQRYNKQLTSFNQEMDENGYTYLLFLRLVPLFPFFLINIFAGITRIPLMTFLWTTIIGILPGSVVYIYAGRQLGLIGRPEDILSWKILLAFVLLGVLILSPALIQKIKRK